MGSETRAGRTPWLLFTLVILRSLALGWGDVHSANPKIEVAENNPVTLSCSFSGFSSPRVEWKFTNRTGTTLVCHDSKITASFEDRVTLSGADLHFKSVTRNDNGTYTCMVTDHDGNTYGEVNVYLTVLVPPSKPTVSIPSSATIGSRAVLICSENDGSPPSKYYWFKNGVPLPLEPKNNRAFSNSSYTLNEHTGELIFDPLTATDSGDYSCQAQNGFGSPMKSDVVHMEAVELNVGGIVAAVLVTLILLGLLIFGIWFAHSRGYFDKAKKGTSSKKVIYNQPSTRSEGDFKQTSSFLV
ncbi:PREDICTED: junctional adhesion molecule A [Condylura cristata]|uniref:junctional adhesion molecule A n=1 Tax=Condylura cristata TaxID=143302 RepID=UPI000643B08F|nr:PREDICTED: junctional adhesion molecule A [Condylura cristata]